MAAKIARFNSLNYEITEWKLTKFGKKSTDPSSVHKELSYGEKIAKIGPVYLEIFDKICQFFWPCCTWRSQMIWLPWHRPSRYWNINFRSIIGMKSALSWWKDCENWSSISGNIWQNTPVFLAVLHLTFTNDLVAMATSLEILENVAQTYHLYIQCFHMVKRLRKSVQYKQRYSTKYASFLGHVEPDVHKWFGCHGNVSWEIEK